ncbi:MAG: MFS transporter [Hyphomicrobiaceae bacterium]|nr:MFS transporter [Hyphomicrobiaceae bacterium]
MQHQLTAIAAATRRPSFRAIAGLGATQIIGWGTTFSALPIFGTPIAQDLGLAREWVFGGITVNLLVAALVAPRVGKLVDRLGARPIMTIGSLVFAVAMLAQSLSWNLESYMLGWVIVGLATPMALGNAAMPGLVQVVGPNARRAIATLMLMSGLTSTIFLPFNAWLIGLIGWSKSYLVFAALHLLICAPLHWLVLKRGSGHEPAAPAPSTNRIQRAFPPEGVLDPPQRRKAFVLLAVWMCTEGFITWGLYLQVIDVFIASGLTMAQAIGVWAIVGPCQSLARLAEIISGGRHSILTTTLGAAFFVSLSFLALLPLGVSIATCIMFCVCMGLGHGLFAIARNTLPLALFGTREFGAYVGLLTVPQNIINAAAPIAFAAIISRASPSWALWISAISAWIGLVAVYQLVKYCRASMKEKGIDV